MNITVEECKALEGIASEAGKALTEKGASCALILWTREVDGVWRMEWSRHGSPYEAVSLAARYAVIDAQESQAHAIAQQINKTDGDDGEAWKGA